MDPISPELLARLPRTFVPALNEQIKNWDVLFPAERRTMSAQMSWLARLPAHEFRDLFEPIKALEARMDLPAWNPRTPRVSINDTSVLVRSPLYPQWRVAVGKVFDRIDAGVKAGKVSPAWNRRRHRAKKNTARPLQVGRSDHNTRRLRFGLSRSSVR
jgi:hypothetical protein